MKHRHLFAGNNTSEGFFSYYDQILPRGEAGRIFCIKGGPEAGKSTLMKMTAACLARRSVMIEYLHCPSDPESLDGILIPALNIALVDGDALNATDSICKGAVDEIINLGEFWDRDGVARHKDHIISISEQKEQFLLRAYRYLAAAKYLMDDALAIYAPADGYGAYAEAEKIINAYINCKTKNTTPGKVRRMFASGITPLGVVSCIDTLIGEDYIVCAVESHWGAGVTELLSRISDAAVMHGLYVEQYCCPMDPANRIDHLVIPACRLALVSHSKYLHTGINTDMVIDMAQYASCGGKAAFAEREFDTLLREALFTLNRAKAANDQLEKYYLPYMDFAAVSDKTEQVIQQIEAVCDVAVLA